MPRTFNDSLEEDLERVFFDTSEFATTVTIQRGVHTTPNVAAIRRNKSYEVIGDDGMATAHVSVDFQIITSHYKIGGVQVEPRRSDVLVNVGGSYAVLPIPGKECFEPSASGDVLTVHTKKVS